jgi:hypothetical protein
MLVAMRASLAINRIKNMVPSGFKSRAKDNLFRFRGHNDIGSPKKWIEVDQYADKFSDNWHVVYGSKAIPRTSPIRYGSQPPGFEIKSSVYPPFSHEVGVLKLRKALIYGGHGWIFTPRGYLLLDHCISAGSHESMLGHVKVPRFLPRGKRLKGVSLTIASDWGPHYGHWLVESLPRLDLFSKAGFKLDDVDHVLCSKPSSGTPEKLFSQLNIPIEKCIWIDPNDRETSYRPDTLLAPSFPRAYQYPLPWAATFLQNEFLPLPRAIPTRRLFLSRKHYRGRNPVNADNVDQILARHGFESFNPESHPASYQVFSEAAVVVGATGSALSGLVFCQRGTKVLELISTDMPLSSSTLADAAGLEYGYLVCESTHLRSAVYDGTPSCHDFYVNEDELDRALTRITSELQS